MEKSKTMKVKRKNKNFEKEGAEEEERERKRVGIRWWRTERGIISKTRQGGGGWIRREWRKTRGIRRIGQREIMDLRMQRQTSF